MVRAPENSVHYLKGVKVPSLFLNAKDDPMAVHEAVPIEKLQNEVEHSVTMLYNCGGHVGFVAGISDLKQVGSVNRSGWMCRCLSF